MAGDENKNIGKQIGGNYRLVAELGRGSFGDVYKAQHIFFANRPQVAIKLLRASLFSLKERERFIQEAQLLNMLSHPHILPILDAGMHEDLPYLVMEYAPGGSLQDRLDKQFGQALSIDEAITVLTQIGDALHYAHQQNIVHRDLKPDNILFNAKGEAVLADFGIAAILSSARTREAGDAGTPAYMAPEMFEGKVSVKSDQYALGCITYELLTGKKPFDVENVGIEAIWFQHTKVEPDAPTLYNPTISLHIEQAILTAMAKDRANRHADVHVFLVALQAPQKSAQQWSKEGNALYSQKRYAEALAALNQAIHLDPNNDVTYFNKGTVLRKLRRYTEALDAYEQAIRLDPNDADYYNGKGFVLRSLQRYAESLDAYEQAIRLAPNNVNYYNGKGIALNGLRQYKEELDVYEQAIRLDPTNAVTYYNKGEALRDLQRYIEALAAYEQAIHLAPNIANYYNGKGAALRHLQRYIEALVTYEQAIHLDPNTASYYNGKGAALRNLQRYIEALAAYEQAIHLDPNNDVTYYNKGVALYNLQRYAEALAAYEQAIRLDPNDADYYNGKGVVLRYLQRYAEALAAYEQAIRLNPHKADYYNGKGLALDKLGRTTEAQQAYEKAKQLGSKG